MFREEKFKKMRNIMTLHHAILIYTIFKLNYTNDYILNHNIPIIAKLYLAEICVIFMNINWLLIKLEKKDTLSFKISNLLLKVSYYIFRVHNFITLTKYYLTTYGIDISFISLLLITALNISWFILLLFK
jgi:TLC domain.